MPNNGKPKKVILEHRPVAQLLPYARNARTHSDEQVTQIAASIREFGWTNPVLIDSDNGIIAGHGRVMAAKLLGVASVPVIVLTHLSEGQKRAYILADNKLALNAGWDEDMLKLELLELAEFGDIDLTITGFSLDEIANITDARAGLVDPDDVPPPPAIPFTQPGDMWLLGDHRLICGDSTVPETVARLLGDAKPHLMVTDPPYGVEYDANWRNEVDRANGKPYGDRAVGKVSNDDRADWSPAWMLFPGNTAYIWHAGRHASEVQRSLEAAGFEIRTQIIWVKQQFAIGRGHYHWRHEPCWYAARKTGKTSWQGSRKETTVWEIDKPVKSETGHSTQKPVECMRRPIENNSAAGDAVYDPFCGSGTTIIAAEMTGRKCFAIELSPAYCDVIVMRWKVFTGRKAVRLADGASFPSLIITEQGAPA